ncbi:MAG: hypothetical protein CVU79_08025 [Elusimicrobia bacterium HGW-Elusimicrobia-3]|nr:MAG: hypothetical protein CVU79_08025 [Elusimicrobia bacterium HGW-Elusimicrobia-3]
MKKLILTALLALVPAGAGALELLLQENRGESGTIGYVDIDRVFKDYSGTAGAREDFLSEIKKKEDALNAKKTAIFTLKAEMAKLRQEREFALTLPSLLETQRSVEQAAAETRAAAAALAAAAVSTQPVAASTEAPAGAEIIPSTAAALPQALPGMGGIDMPGVAKVPVAHFKFSVSTSVPEIEAALQKKEAEVVTREAELRQAQRQAERELLEYESRKGELLLGRIYVALRELAIKEEVSVVVDKRNILYGQNAVDLTGKLLKKLEENGL